MDRDFAAVTIITDRLVIRPWQRADLDAMDEWLPFPDPIDEEWNWPQQLRNRGGADFFFIGRSGDPRRFEWSILHSGGVIGYLGIREIDHRSARLGIHFGYPYVDQGYGAEALRAFLDTFFGLLAFNEMKLDVRSYNFRARRLYERFGFRRVRRFWQSAGSIEALAFLDEPQYDAVRRYFRRDAHAMLVECIEMTLSADQWRQQHAV